MERLKTLRESYKMTQKQFGERLKLSQKAISQYENGTRKMNNAIKLLICKECSVNLEWLEHGIGEMHDYQAMETKLGERERNILEKFKKLNDEQQAYILEWINKRIKN